METTKIDDIRMPLTSLDITQDRMDRLRELFPDVFAEGKIDFDKLRQVLGENVGTGRERYGLTWAGKADAKGFSAPQASPVQLIAAVRNCRCLSAWPASSWDRLAALCCSVVGSAVQPRKQAGPKIVITRCHFLACR